MQTIHRLASVMGLVILSVLQHTHGQAAMKQPAAAAEPAPLVTRWAKDVDRVQPWPEYPRPTLVRDRWQNLNGVWEYEILDGILSVEAALDPARRPVEQGEILVPFPIESRLSGVMKRVGPNQTLMYKRKFRVPKEWLEDRVALNFGAVDWYARVIVNGQWVQTHRGGYDDFSTDISGKLHQDPEVENELIVLVNDPTNEGGQPRGKQWNKPHGIWYTPTTGIWQTVWLEPTRIAYLTKVMTTFDAAAQTVTVQVQASAPTTMRLSSKWWIRCKVSSACGGGAEGEGSPDKDELSVTLPLSKICRWSPESPNLYELDVEFVMKGIVMDRARSYFAIRDVGVKKDSDGHNRLTLNGEPIFHFGPLDQGFWPDGLYTAPTVEAMKFDIEAAKKMGCNMLRKHVKVEPALFYHWCDKLGIMVWQDMPSPFFEQEEAPHQRAWDEDFPPLSGEWKANFEQEWQRIMTALSEHPSIVMWVPFNEGWGQNDLEWSREMTLKTKQWDPSRLVNCASGWTDTKVGDVFDVHIYPGPGAPSPKGAWDDERAMVLGEYGGLGLPIEGRTWLAKDNWGYVSYKNKEELTDAYVKQLEQMPWLIADGLAAAVYTQTTDVEIEVNGWMTYDREEWKIDPARGAAAAKKLGDPAPSLRRILPHAGQLASKPLDDGRREVAVWRYSFEAPAGDWMSPEFDDTKWKEGRAGFGTAITPGAVIGTEWNGPEIWIRRSVELPRVDGGAWHEPALWIHHDEDAEVYINGKLAASLPRYTTGYQIVPLSKEAAKLLKPGSTNTIAVHVKQTAGGQYIDLGLVDLVPRK